MRPWTIGVLALVGVAVCWAGPETVNGPTAKELLSAAEAITSYHCVMERDAKKATLEGGRVAYWTPREDTIETRWRRPGDFAVTFTLHDQALPGTDGSELGDFEEQVFVTPQTVWTHMRPLKLAGKMPLERIREVKGEAKMLAVIEEAIGEADPLRWLLRIDPETASIVEAKAPEEEQDQEPATAAAGEQEEGDAPTLYVIEGTTALEPFASLAAERKHLKPRIRVTVAADGFPREAIVEGYASHDVLKLTVTDYELNVEFPDETFQFTPPEGCRVMEADPTKWK